MIVTLIEKVYSFLWGDLVQIPLPGGSTLGISLLIILLIPTGNLFYGSDAFSADSKLLGDRGRFLTWYTDRSD